MSNVRSYGAIGDGIADDTAAFICAVAALTPYSSLQIPAGNYCIDSSKISGNQLALPCGHVSIVGDGRFSSVITLTGPCVTSFVFGADGFGDIEVSAIGMVGNNQADGFANGAALSWKNNGATGDIRGFSVRDCHFENFRGDFWIYAENTLGTHAMAGLSVVGCTFTSRTGNSRLPTLVSAPQGCVGAFGHASNHAGAITDIRIAGNTASCTYMKGFASLFNVISRYSIVDNTITGAGADACFADDSACYAIIVYAAVSYGPTNGTISNNRIYGVRDVGMYLLENHNLSVCGNVIQNQTSTSDTSLPKAAIAINGGRLVSVIGNSIDGCSVGIFFDGSILDGHSESIISGNTIRNASKYIVRIESATYGWNGLTVQGNTLSGTGLGVSINVNADDPVSGVMISGNAIRSGTTGVDVQSGNGSRHLSDISVMGNTISAPITYISAVSFAAAKIAIAGNVLSGNSQCGIDIRASKNVTVTGNHFRDNATGCCLLSIAAEGTVWGNTFENVLQPNVVSAQDPTDLGRVAPTFVGSYGQRVQNLIPMETGTAGVKHIIQGWIYCAGWLPQLTTTGN